MGRTSRRSVAADPFGALFRIAEPLLPSVHMLKRVLIAGIYHETNTFLEGQTLLEEFQILRGSELLSAEGDFSPLGGCLEAAREGRWEVLPAVDMRAMPGAVVEDRAIDFFWNELESVARSAGGRNVDGVLLVLHGAMVSQSCDDVEGEILGRIRNLYGPTKPICGVIDLHANFTSRMARHSDALVAYRENPHTDAKEAAARAASLLGRLMRTGERPTTIWEHPPVMWPPTGTATASEPMCLLEAMAREIEKEDDRLLVVNVLGGFAFADISEPGVSFTAVTIGDADVARNKLRRLDAMATAKRYLGNLVDPPVGEIMREIARQREGPIVVAEPSDNVGAGAPGSGTGLLGALLEHSIDNAVVMINDLEAVQRVKGLRNGDHVQLAIGGKGSRFYPPPVELDVVLVCSSDGKFELEDPHSHLASISGKQIDMGPCAVVRHRGIRILLTTRKTPPFDLGQLRSQGIVPEKAFVIGVKAAVAHRRAYDPIARATHTVDTPGPCSSDLKSFPYQKIQRPVYPLDPLPENFFRAALRR
jgi:microcystin degradation protein MlrC